MKMNLFSLALILICLSASGQSGVVYGTGNQLIPLDKTNIILQKEMLTLSRANATDGLGRIRMDVYYEFFNPGEEQTIVVGLETDAPSGAEGPEKYSPKNEIVYNLKITMNNNEVSYVPVIVPNKDYYENGKFKTLSKAEIEKSIEAFDDNGWEVNYQYVYHFKATFKKGLNIVKHSYELSWSFNDNPQAFFIYNLYSASKWANKKIADFTLRVDFGERAYFSLENTLPSSEEKLKITGTGKKQEDTGYGMSESGEFTTFFVKKGYVEYQTQNLDAENQHLYLTRPSEGLYSFDYTERGLAPISYYPDENIEVADEVSKKVLRNLPFAIRGYIFKDPVLSNYYSEQFWYMPDPNYKGDPSSLTPREQQWVKLWGK